MIALETVIPVCHCYDLLNLSVGSEGTPTYEHQNGKIKTYIDYFLSSSKDWIETTIIDKNNKYGVENTSPHNILCTERPTKTIRSQKTAKKTSGVEQCHNVKWEDVDIPKYRDILAEEVAKTDFHLLDPEGGLSVLTNLIQTAVAASSNTQRKKPLRISRKVMPWSENISAASQKAKRIFWEWKEMGRPPLPHILAVKKNKAKKALRTAQRQDQAQKRTKLLKDIMAASEDDNKTFHKLVQRNRRMTAEALIFKEEMVFEEDTQRSEWAEYFQTLSSADADLDENDTTMLHLIREKFQGTPVTIPKLTCYDVERTIRSLNKGKAPDTDGISAEHLQFAPMECISALTEIINKIFIEGTVPSACKSGFKIPIPKEGKDCRLPSNHHGITITAIMGKVVEKITQYHTDEILLPKQNELQFGFTKGLPPIMATLCLTEAAAAAKSSKTALLVGALDVQKAFDVVNHQKLKIKLHNDGVDSTSWRIIDSLYSDISEKVRWKASYSQSFTVGKGVRQGAVWMDERV